MHNPAPIFSALGDETRLALLTRLSDGQPRSISSLSDETTLTRQAITKHLHVLESAGLVVCRRVGRESLFSFRPEPVFALQDYLDRVSEQWDQRLERLKAMVEGLK